jgi:hypothetical protein
MPNKGNPYGPPSLKVIRNLEKLTRKQAESSQHVHQQIKNKEDYYMTSEDIVLSPCPLCEGKSAIDEYEVDSNGLGRNPYTYVKIGCEKCKLFIDVPYKDKNLAVDRWNQRPEIKGHLAKHLQSKIAALADEASKLSPVGSYIMHRWEVIKRLQQLSVMQ